MTDFSLPFSARFERMTATVSHVLARTRAQIKTIRFAEGFVH